MKKLFHTLRWQKLSIIGSIHKLLSADIEQRSLEFRMNRNVFSFIVCIQFVQRINIYNYMYTFYVWLCEDCLCCIALSTLKMFIFYYQ